MRTILVGALCAIAMVANANAAIKEEPVTYTDGETTMKGVVVYDDAIATKRPGIVMVHEWWGITKHIHDEARKFAQQGYTAFIADMYGDAKTADNPKDAGALSSSVMKNPKVMESRFNAARDQLAKQASVNPGRIGAVGYCFGGAVVLNMARTGADLAAVAGFHASLGLNTPAPAPGTVKGEDPHPERRGRSLRKARAVRCAQEGFRRREGRLSDHRISRRSPRVHEPRSHRDGQEVQPTAQIRRQGGSGSKGRGDQVLRR